MFYPFRKLQDLQLNGSYLNLFFRELQLFKNEMMTMLKKEFNILQNIENRRVLQCNPPKKQDYMMKNTINKLDTDIKQKKNGNLSPEEKDIVDIRG